MSWSLRYTEYDSFESSTHRDIEETHEIPLGATNETEAIEEARGKWQEMLSVRPQRVEGYLKELYPRNPRVVYEVTFEELDN